MPHGQVKGPTRGIAERDADNLGDQRVQGSGFQVHGEPTAFAQLFGELFDSLQLLDQLVVDLHIVGRRR